MKILEIYKQNAENSHNRNQENNIQFTMLNRFKLGVFLNQEYFVTNDFEYTGNVQSLRMKNRPNAPGKTLNLKNTFCIKC